VWQTSVWQIAVKANLLPARGEAVVVPKAGNPLRSKLRVELTLKPLKWQQPRTRYAGAENRRTPQQANDPNGA